MRHNQNRRSRGRNNNRKGPNPLTRSFESNGPDVKVRGTAAHIAEKYTSLARDAQSAGDIVAVESYLQHAEHYNRIVMAAQAQFQQTQPQFRDGPDEGYDDDRQMNGRSRERFEYNGESRGGEDEGEERMEAGEEEGEERGYQARAPRQEGYRQQGQRQERYQYRDRQDRDNRDRDDRNDRGDRPERMDRAEGPERGDRPERSERGERPERTARPERAERQESYEEREPRREPIETQPAEQEPDAPSPRRRRGRSRNENGGGEEAGNARNPDATPDGAAALAAFKGES